MSKRENIMHRAFDYKEPSPTLEQMVEKLIAPAAPTEAPAQEPQQYDPRTDPSTNWVLDYAIELERIQESRNHVLIDGRGNKSPVLTRDTIIDAIWKYLAATQAESAGKPDVYDFSYKLSELERLAEAGECAAALKVHAQIAGEIAKLRAELEQANQEKYRALNRLHETMQAAESSVTRLTRERDEANKEVERMTLVWAERADESEGWQSRAETAEREREELRAEIRDICEALNLPPQANEIDVRNVARAKAKEATDNAVKYFNLYSTAERERDESASSLRVLMEETVLAGFPAGDRVQTLANVRALRREREEAREAVKRLTIFARGTCAGLGHSAQMPCTCKEFISIGEAALVPANAEKEG